MHSKLTADFKLSKIQNSEHSLTKHSRLSNIHHHNSRISQIQFSKKFHVCKFNALLYGLRVSFNKDFIDFVTYIQDSQIILHFVTKRLTAGWFPGGRCTAPPASLSLVTEVIGNQYPRCRQIAYFLAAGNREHELLSRETLRQNITHIPISTLKHLSQYFNAFKNFQFRIIFQPILNVLRNNSETL